MPKTQVFTPVGGMNQDDSAITPTPDMAGRNAFGLGDYKYALNSRIGSSQSDNFGDLENIRGTVEKTSYFVRDDIGTNSDFSSGLTGWSQVAVAGGVAWVNAFGVNVPATVGAYVSNILYQAVAPAQRRIGIQVKINVSGSIENSSYRLVFLQGTTILSGQTIITDATRGVAFSNHYAKYINVELPSGCNGVGIQMFGNSALGGAASITGFRFFNWVAGARPSGVERVIGKKENKEFNLLFYHVYNASGNHCIRYYDPISESIYELLQWSGLDYGSTYFVSCAMIDNYMAFTDRNNSPRLIDIYTVSDLFLILDTDFREYHISFHRWAPTMPAVLSGYYDSVVNNYQKFEGKTEQFSYRYVYQGRLKSRWAPDSAVAQNFLLGSGNEITSIKISIPGFTLDEPGVSTSYNYFNNDDVKFTAVVESIEIGYRESAIDLWRILKRYDLMSSENSDFYYDGNANSTPIPVDDFEQLFDTVPFIAGAVEAIDNRFMFADCIDEHPAAPPVEVTDVGVVKFDSLGSLGNWWNAGSNDAANNAALFSGCSAGDADILGKRNYICDTTFKGRGMYKLGIQWIAASGWRSAVYTVDNWLYNIAAEVGVLDKQYALTFKFPSSFRPPEWAVSYQIMRTNVLNIDYFMFGIVNAFVPLVDDVSTILDKVQMPDVLKDRIRQHFENNRIVAGNDVLAEIQKVANEAIAADEKKNRFRNTVAKGFKVTGLLSGDFGGIAQTGLGVDKLLKTNPIAVKLIPEIRKTKVFATVQFSSRIYLDINNWYNASANNNPRTQDNPMNSLYYNYREGDYVRFIGSDTAVPTNAQKKIYDVKIIEFTGKGVIVEKPSSLLWLPGFAESGAVRNADYIIECYTPRSYPVDDDYLYYETGEWYPVLYPGTEQRDLSKRDWTFTNTAGITCSTYGDVKVFNKRPMSYGDCHGVDKTFYFDNTSPRNINNWPLSGIPSMNPDPKKTYDFWEKCNGRAALAYTDLPVVRNKTTMIRFGGQIIEQSFINMLNNFKEEDQRIFPSEYGRIRALVNTANAQVESAGSILLTIGERETFSIYVNRTTLEDLSGQSQVSLSDRVLGSYNTLLGSHGTLNPESVYLNRGRVWYWDALNGSWIRYGRDGLTPITDYKMRNWYKELGDLLITKYGTDEEPKVISGFDNFNQELVNFISHSSLPATFRGYSTYKGAMFSEQDRRWKSIHSYEPEMFACMNNTFISFNGGSLFLHEKGGDESYSTFYGEKFNVMIEPVFNDIPKNTKSWQTISLVTTDAWNVDRFLSEYQGTKPKQQSNLPLAKLNEKEGNFYSEILMDENTPLRANPLIEGNKMRSKIIRALLKLDPDVVTLSLLHYVEVGDIDSPKNA
jgi:hypothetical protein